MRTQVYAALGMKDVTAEQYAAARWHPLIDGPESGVHVMRLRVQLYMLERD